MGAVTNSAAATALGSYQSVARSFVMSFTNVTDTWSGSVYHGLGVSPDTVIPVITSIVATASFNPAVVPIVTSWNASVVNLLGPVGSGAAQLTGVVFDLYCRREHSIVR